MLTHSTRSVKSKSRRWRSSAAAESGGRFAECWRAWATTWPAGGIGCSRSDSVALLKAFPNALIELPSRRIVGDIHVRPRELDIHVHLDASCRPRRCGAACAAHRSGIRPKSCGEKD